MADRARPSPPAVLRSHDATVPPPAGTWTTWSDVAETCTHLDTVTDVVPSGQGCAECLRSGGRWVHLRMCTACGHVGCCESSPGRHASAHWRAHRDHPLVRSYEPGEDWWWCYPDQLLFEVDGAPPAPSYT